MTKWTQQEIGKVRSIIGVACEVAGKPAPSQDAFAIAWVDLLERQGLTAQQVVVAVQAHMMDADRGRFAPRPADVIAAIRGSGDERAAIAWAAVMQAVRSYGAGASVVFDDPATTSAVARMGGWVRVCAMTDAEREPRWHEFRRIYAGLIGGIAPADAPPVLRGLSAEWDEATGKEPVRVLTGVARAGKELPA
jgi:hypothetical protein